MGYLTTVLRAHAKIQVRRLFNVMHYYRCDEKQKGDQEKKTGLKKQILQFPTSRKEASKANDNKRSITYEKNPAAREKGPFSLLDH